MNKKHQELIDNVKKLERRLSILEYVVKLKKEVIQLTEENNRLKRDTIEGCIKQLGGRYGAQATKDLRSMIK